MPIICLLAPSTWDSLRLVVANLHFPGAPAPAPAPAPSAAAAARGDRAATAGRQLDNFQITKWQKANKLAERKTNLAKTFA